ncbi:MAG TPA: 2Fe-2S iron-sulfur cluster-binding protein [Candidatus Binataceae bacterium]|nr:2Fe-2S iron-sulfur cluster-binding protein [Candidatus Binataceae bacterium]
MKSQTNEAELEARLKRMTAPAIRPSRGLASRFAARLGEVAARPDAVPIRLCGAKLEARSGGTLLAAAVKNGVRMMHACGAQTLCATCRVKVTDGADNLSPMSTKEKISLRYHLSISPGVRLACQARVLGPVEADAVFPLCGTLPGEA